MKIHDTNDVVVERDGISSDGAFTIQFNSKMAKILSDGLYSDKIQSIIRELSCNAIDSHVEAGKSDVPIEVHLPTMFEPWFYVRDYGVGLDHDQVISIYTCYGASTKTNSNEFIGQLGLGSKSPFSYVDAFDVTARKNGVERQYSMYKNEEGMPSVALLGEKATDDQDGVTVKMPVINGDYNRFAEKARQVFRWFTVKPRVTGVSEFSVPHDETIWAGSCWAVRKRVSSPYSYTVNSPVALMGKVAYPLTASSISGLNEIQRAALMLPLTLHFDIGELEVAASREALGYNTRTQNNIKKKIDIMVSELGKIFEESVKTASTEWEACKLFGSIFSYETGMRSELETIYGKKGLEWQGKLITSNAISLDTSQLWDKTVVPGLYNFRGGYKSLRQFPSHQIVAVRCSDNTQIVFNDLTIGGKSRVTYLRDRLGNDADILYIDSDATKTPAEIVSMLGDAPYMFASQLPKRPVTKRERVHLLRFTGESSKKAWVPADVDLEDGGFYVMLNHYDVLDNGLLHQNFENTVRWAKDCGILSESAEIYAPRYSLKNKIADQEDWVEFFGWLRKQITQRLVPSVAQISADDKEFASVCRQVRDHSLWKNPMRIENPHSVFSKWREAMKVLEISSKQSDKNSSLIFLAQRFGQDLVHPAPSVNAHDLWTTVEATYPMLILSLDRYGYINLGDNQHVVNYINMVDKMVEVTIETAVSSVINA